MTTSTQHTIPGLHCGVCLAGITDEDCKRNHSDHEHDGYWCSECLRAYEMNRAAALAHLSARLHKLSWLEVRTLNPTFRAFPWVTADTNKGSNK